MPEIKHNILSDYLNSLSPDTIPPIFFIWGEEFLCRKVFDALISFLLPDNLKELCYEVLEGEEAVIPVIAERISTYSFFQEKKVIAIKNAPLFGGSSSQSVSNTSSIFSNNEIETLKTLIEKGFPENHYLVITSLNADKRRALFNTIKTYGAAIDCSVSQGSSKSDKEEQSEMLRMTMKEILDKAGKGIDGDAFYALTEMTGFAPAALADSLERLTSFIGNRDTINLRDVHALVKRTKKDAIFEFTNALAQKNLESSLFYYKSLCDNGFHPLQLLASMVNQIRKIFAVKLFILSEAEKGNICWKEYSSQNYKSFAANTMTLVTKADNALENIFIQWNEEQEDKSEENDFEDDSYESGDSYDEYDDKYNNENKKSKKGNSVKKSTVSKKISTDLIIAPNPKNAYPIFQTFLKSDNFEINELGSILMELSEIDYKLKSSSDSDIFIVLEEMIIRICTNIFKNRIL